MFLRSSVVKKGGKTYRYWKLVENLRTDTGPRQLKPEAIRHKSRQGSGPYRSRMGPVSDRRAGEHRLLHERLFAYLAWRRRETRKRVERQREDQRNIRGRLRLYEWQGRGAGDLVRRSENGVVKYVNESAKRLNWTPDY